MAQAKAPLFLVIGGAVGNPVWVLGQGGQVRAQLRQSHTLVHGAAVVQHVQVGGFEVNHPLTFVTFSRIFHQRFNISVANRPFFGHVPVKHGCAAGHFVDGDGQQLLNMRHGFAHAGAGDAAANRVQRFHELVHLSP